MAEWTKLFDGETLKGWGVTGESAGWTVEDGCIACTGQKGGYLYTERKDYKDFELEMEFKHDGEANSGVFFRWTDLDDPVQTGMEIQIMDTFGREPATTHCSGALYDIQPPTHNSCKPAGEWNALVLSANGHQVDVTLNGEHIVDCDLSRWTEAGKQPDGSPNKFKRPYCEMVDAGHIGIQGDHKGRIWLRNVKVRQL